MYTNPIEISTDEDTESVNESDIQSNKGTWKQVAVKRQAHNKQSGKRNNKEQPMKRNENKSNSKKNNKGQIKMTVIGDSQLHNLDGSKLTNEHHTVKVIPDPGARIV